MEQRHNSAALISTALLFVVVVMLYSVPALTAHGFVPKASLLGDALWMHAAGIVSVLGFIQYWRIGGGLDDFVLGSSFSFSAEDLKEHGFMLPIFVAVASNSFFIAVLVSLLMLVFGAE